MTQPRENSSEDSRGISPPSAAATVASSSNPPIASTTRCTYYRQCTRIPWDNRPNDPDPRINLSQPLHGWPALAQVIENVPAFEAFPAFRDLNIKSLLYYQCELTALREELHALEWDDHVQGEFEGASEFSRRVDCLLKSEGNKDEKAHQQIDLIKKIREVLDKYNHALLQYSQINALPKADARRIFNVDSLRMWLRNPGLGGLQISGPGADTWGKLTEVETRPLPLSWQFLNLFTKRVERSRTDLVIPQTDYEVDGITVWVADRFIPFWRSVRVYITGDEESLPKATTTEKRLSNTSTLRQWISHLLQRNRSSKNTEEVFEDGREALRTISTYSSSMTMIRSASFVATVTARLLPTIAICVLALVHTTTKLLGFIALFTAIFAMGLIAFSDQGTSSTQVFTATVAFTAIMVVFVQNQNGKHNCLKIIPPDPLT